jgi:hypothetical protein
MSTIGRKPLLCRVGLHHHWVRERTSDGGRFWHCDRCGKDRDERIRGASPFG